MSGTLDGGLAYNDFVYTLLKWEEIVSVLILLLRGTNRKKQCIRTIVAKCAIPSYTQHFSDCDK